MKENVSDVGEIKVDYRKKLLEWVTQCTDGKSAVGRSKNFYLSCREVCHKEWVPGMLGKPTRVLYSAFIFSMKWGVRLYVAGTEPWWPENGENRTSSVGSWGVNGHGEWSSSQAWLSATSCWIWLWLGLYQPQRRKWTRGSLAWSKRTEQSMESDPHMEEE